MGADGTRHGALILTRRSVGTAIRGLVRSLLPKQLADFVRHLRLLNSRERLVFLRLRMRRWGRVQPDVLLDKGTPPRRVLFICHGNIIRSPMCEVLLRDIARRAGDDGLTVESAGLHARLGKAADPRAKAAAPEFGVSLDSHRATPLQSEAVERADLVFVMDWLNAAQFIARFPRSQSKVLLLGAFGRASAGEAPIVADPYAQSDEAVIACYRRLDVAVRALASKIVRAPERQMKGIVA